MLRMTPAPNVYLACGVTDLRNNINGLALIVEKQFHLDLFSASMFGFCNRTRDKIKILYWDKNGKKKTEYMSRRKAPKTAENSELFVVYTVTMRIVKTLYF